VSVSPIDQRRLQDGEAALEASRRIPTTYEEAKAQLAQIDDAIAAMQSLDDLGEEGNQRAEQQIADLWRWHKMVKALVDVYGSNLDAIVKLPRDVRQLLIAGWAKMAFGDAEATSLPQRGLRLLEEAVETFQACGGEAAIAHKLVDFVFARPKGTIGQELGGVAVTVLALAQAAGISADEEEVREIHRVFAKPLSEFSQRNASKNAAGFKIA
jgi:NTP pyrophosphatase (non-canonical NTP hydrolase)